MPTSNNEIGKRLGDAADRLRANSKLKAWLVPPAPQHELARIVQQFGRLRAQQREAER